MNSTHTQSLQVDDLRLVSAVCEHGTLSRAATVLHLSQSALSHRLSTLEGSLGVKLFDRLGKSMRPTTAGLRLKRSAEPILDAMQVAERTVRSKAGMEKLTLKLATQCYTCYHWLPAVLQDYKKQCPGCDVSILLEATQNPMEALIEGAIDVAIIDQFHRKDRRVQVHQIFSDEVLAVASATHRWAKKRYVVPEDFSKERLIAHNCSSDHNVLLKRFLGPANVVPAETFQVPLTEAILELVKSGFGVTALSRWAVSSHLGKGSLCGLSIGRHGFPRNWSIAMLKSTSRLEHVRLFVDLLARSMQR